MNASLVEKARGTILGAAVGDAMGWPQEFRTARPSLARSAPGVVASGFVPWVRRTGGQYYPHEELVRDGEYSDDTQLILCTARSVLRAEDRWRSFVQQELPAWTLYERGAGRATRASVATWVRGLEPWSARLKQSERESYFLAGGNGVAMRICPHCIVGAESEDFSSVGREIMANGVCTHGHPRALIGALVYGFALWSALRQKATLPYGGLIDVAIREGVPDKPPDMREVWPDWRSAVDNVSSEDYEAKWLQAHNEMLELLGVCNAAIGKGALSLDRDVLSQLGCFDKTVGSAGTITAAAAIFLASRYAADPMLGVQEAAFANGADTDTIASMTAALLGALNGSGWLGGYSRGVQDSDYLNKVSELLVASRAETWRSIPPRARSATRAIDSIKNAVERMKPGDSIALPDGRTARVQEVIPLATKSRATTITSLKFMADDGQTLYVKKMSRNRGHQLTDAGTLLAQAKLNLGEQGQNTDVLRTGIKLPVRDLHAARDFYKRVLGLNDVHYTPTVVNINRVIALVHVGTVDTNRGSSVEGQPTVFIETRSIERVCQNIEQRGAKIVTPLTDSPSRRFFRCSDPDGNLLEFYEKKPPLTPGPG